MPVRILQGDCRQVLASLPDDSVHCCVTSPPYFGLRDYGMPEQIGMEPTPAEFVANLVAVFREVRRVLRPDGTLWLNIGDSYAGGGGGNYSKSAKQTSHGGHITNVRNRPDWLAAAGLKAKDLIGVPWMLAFALRAEGWFLRQDIVWSKPNAMPESVQDRCTKAHEYVFLLSKSPSYYFDSASMKEPAAGEQLTRNRRSVWAIATKPFRGAHFATMAPDLAEACIKAGCPIGGTVLDPFGGAGTTGLVAGQLQRDAVLIELNPAYIDIARRRIEADAPLFAA